MKQLFKCFPRRSALLLTSVFVFLALSVAAVAQESDSVSPSPSLLSADSALADSLSSESIEQIMADEGIDADFAPAGAPGFHSQLKQKFLDGGPVFMSLVALVLVLGLALCIERIIYLTLADVDHHKLAADVDALLEADDVEGAKQLCRSTRGPVASVCYQGLMHIDEPIETVERSIVSYGTLQSSLLERGCSWITLFISIAPSLGFLGTVVGMVMAFDQIQQAGDIGPTIVAEGMKVALITTIFGIIVALVLQLFYNYILAKIERLTTHMEEAAIVLLDAMMARNRRLNLNQKTS